jgi:hypothetical protein
VVKSLGNLKVSVKDASGQVVAHNTMETKEGEYVVKYATTTSGDYVIQIQVENQDIQKSPFTVQVVPSLDTSGVSVRGNVGSYNYW